jgi:hypothetical protein
VTLTACKRAHLRELLDREEGVKLSLGLGQALGVGRVDEEDDAVDLGEVVTPEPASWTVDGSREGKGGG